MPEAIVRPPTHPKINAVEVAFNYANDVISGAIVAGKLVKLAAKRFLRDLKYGSERGIYLDANAAQHVVDFFGFLHHSKGEWGGQVFVLAPWQVFILVNLFGWKNADGYRRYREGYIEIARKNGKSTLLAGIGLYMLFADDEPGAEVYCAATKKDQAKIVFDEAVKMRKASELLASRIGAFRNNLHVLSTHSKFEPLSAEDDKQDGLNTHCAVIDELHAHPTRGLYDVLYESTASRRQPLIFSITTAGYNRQGICYKTREYGERTLVGAISAQESDHFFCYIACIDEDDNWEDEKVWMKANPNLGISVKPEKLRVAASKAKEDPTALNSFLRKHLNVWTNQDVKWMPPDKWAACNAIGPLISPRTTRVLALQKLAGRECYGGLDISSKIDLAAFVLIFPPVAEIKDKRPKPQTKEQMWARQPVEFEEIVIQKADPKWSVVPWFFVPKDNVPDRVKRDRVRYDVWIKEGYIFDTPGNVVDQDFIRTTMNQLRGTFQIREVGFDSWNATQLALNLQGDGFTMVEIRQGFKSMTEPMKECMGLVLSKKLEHYGNPVLTWCFGNVMAKVDPAGNIMPDKAQSAEKIDGAVATFMALHRVVQNPASQPSVYSERGIIFI